MKLCEVSHHTVRIGIHFDHEPLTRTKLSKKIVVALPPAPILTIKREYGALYWPVYFQNDDGDSDATELEDDLPTILERPGPLPCSNRRATQTLTPEPPESVIEPPAMSESELENSIDRRDKFRSLMNWMVGGIAIGTKRSSFVVIFFKFFFLTAL